MLAYVLLIGLILVVNDVHLLRILLDVKHLVVWRVARQLRLELPLRARRILLDEHRRVGVRLAAARQLHFFFGQLRVAHPEVLGRHLALRNRALVRLAQVVRVVPRLVRLLVALIVRDHRQIVSHLEARCIVGLVALRDLRPLRVYLLIATLSLEVGVHPALPRCHELLVRLRVHHHCLVVGVPLGRCHPIGGCRACRWVLRVLGRRLPLVLRGVEADLDPAVVAAASSPTVSVRLRVPLRHAGVISAGLLDAVLHVFESGVAGTLHAILKIRHRLVVFVGSVHGLLRRVMLAQGKVQPTAVRDVPLRLCA